MDDSMAVYKGTQMVSLASTVRRVSLITVTAVIIDIVCR